MEPASRGFKRKTIIFNLKEKLNEWIKTIDDDNVKSLIKEDCIVTGGAIASMLLGELPNDYDIYFRKKSTAAAVAKYYLNKISIENMRSGAEVLETDIGAIIIIKSAGISSADGVKSDYSYFEALPTDATIEYFAKMNKTLKANKKDYDIAMISSNAITLHGGIQIITRFAGDTEEIHGFFDFVHATNSFSFKDGLILKPEAMEAVLAKELKYVGSKYPICSMFRIKKFLNRGYNITAGEMLKIAWDINKLDLNNMEVLKDQLIGVDVAYFNQLIQLLDKQGKDIDRTYLYEAINRVFDTDEFDTVDE